MKRSFWLLLPAAAGLALFSAGIRARTSPSLTKAALHKQEVPITSQLATVQVTGVASGKFPTSAVLSFDYNVLIPLDAATGLPTGQRLHKPVTFTKQVDSASPLYLSALCTNETLKTVAFNYSRTSEGTGKTIYYTVTLTNATVQNFHQSTMKTEKDANTDKLEVEEVSLTFQKIQVTWTDGGITATDDWLTGGN